MLLLAPHVHHGWANGPIHLAAIVTGHHLLRNRTGCQVLANIERRLHHRLFRGPLAIPPAPAPNDEDARQNREVALDADQDKNALPRPPESKPAEKEPSTRGATAIEPWRDRKELTGSVDSQSGGSVG